MWFAIAFLLFFSLDILIVYKFHVFGMLPYTALVCSVSLYTLFMTRHIVRWQKPWLNRSVSILWMVFLALIFLENLFYTTYRLFWKAWLSAEAFDVIISRSNHLCLFGAIILFISSFFIKLNDRSLQRWFLFTGGATALNFIIPVFIDSVPSMIYRYEGFLGMPMLFGWLMINMTILNIKYSPGIEQLRIVEKTRSVH